MEICRKTSLIYPDYCYFFSRRNIEPFWTYKKFSSLEDEHVHSPPIYGRSIKWRNCQKRQLMKWVGIFQVRIFWVGIFRRGGIFQAGVWWVGIFRGNFPRTVLKSLFNKVAGMKPETLLKRDSSTGAILWYLWNVEENLLQNTPRRSFLKRQMSGTSSDNELCNEWYNEWRRMTTSGTMSENE